MNIYPYTRRGWVAYYAEIYKKTGRETAATLALWYYLLDLADPA